MPTIYSPGQISAGTLNVAPINIGTQKSLEILNYSSYFLCLATTQAGATDKNDHSLVTVIEPWQGIRMPVPIGTANTQLYVGVDPTLSTNPVTFGNVVDLPGVQYQTFNVVVVPSRWALLGQSVVNPDGATVGTLVNNTISNPSVTQAGVGTFDDVTIFYPTDSAYGGAMYNQLYTLVPSSVGGYIKRVTIYVMNLNNTNEGNLYVYYSNGDQVLAQLPIPATANTVPQYPIIIDFGTGIPNNGLWLEVSSAGGVNGTVYICGTIVTTQQNAYAYPKTIS